MLKAEAKLHADICDHLRTEYPGVMFRTDFAAGVKMTIGQAKKHKSLQSCSGWPDIFIAEPRGKFHGLFIELKAEGVTVYLKNGNLTSDKHIREQDAVHGQLEAKGYIARFAIGFVQAKYLIDCYLQTGTVPDRKRLSDFKLDVVPQFDDELPF
jgi:hypothetical protein